MCNMSTLAVMLLKVGATDATVPDVPAGQHDHKVSCNYVLPRDEAASYLPAGDFLDCGDAPPGQSEPGS